MVPVNRKDKMHATSMYPSRARSRPCEVLLQHPEQLVSINTSTVVTFTGLTPVGRHHRAAPSKPSSCDIHGAETSRASPPSSIRNVAFTGLTPAGRHHHATPSKPDSCDIHRAKTSRASPPSCISNVTFAGLKPAGRHHHASHERSYLPQRVPR